MSSSSLDQTTPIMYRNSLDWTTSRSGGGVVDNTLDHQSRDLKIDPPLLLLDDTLNQGPVSV